jgi:hypothetical protein
MKLKEWQDQNSYTIKQASDFFCVPKRTYEKWLFQDVMTPRYILKMIEMDDTLKAIDAARKGEIK